MESLVSIALYLIMSALLFVLYTRFGGSFFIIDMVHWFRMSSKDVYTRGFIDFVVMSSHLPFVSDKKVGSNTLIDSIFLDIGMMSLYIVCASMLWIGTMARLCRNAFFYNLVFVYLFTRNLSQSVWNKLDTVVIFWIRP